MNKILIPVLLFIAASCTGNNENQATEEDSLVKQVNVNTEQISPRSFNTYLRVVGVVETSDDILISAEVSGRILEHRVKEGERVQEGETIIRIDDSKLKQEISRLEAVTSQARENYERIRAIYEEDGIGSEIEVLNARYSYEQSSSALESVRVDLNNTNIKAPFGGVVEDIMIEVGEMAGPGMPVVRIIGDDQYKVTTGIPARYADVIRKGDPVDVWFDTQYSDTLVTRLSFVGNSIDPQNRTFKAEAILPKEMDFYKVDMITNMKLTTLSEDSVVVISEQFVYKNNEDYVTYVLDEDENGNPIGRLTRITLGPSYQSNVIVTSGLNFGDELITTGSAFLNDGTRVRVLGDETMASN
ncbi:efflux RND transporter periplasmic adaptor subunit [Balneola sp. MJW-20]|uniref:efflux RND transporter periplasmic adaptor subunit n=1 Tax=Gracilimonas aurantiaca TaxID=3234185 RepID=UPI003467DA61